MEPTRKVNILDQMRRRLASRRRTKAEQEVYRDIKLPKKRKKKWQKR